MQLVRTAFIGLWESVDAFIGGYLYMTWSSDYHCICTCSNMEWIMIYYRSSVLDVQRGFGT